MYHRKPIWIAIVAALVVLPQIALRWWNRDWKFRKRLTIDASVITAAVSAGQTEISLPVRLDGGNFPYFADLDKSGGYLRFVAADDRTPLEYRVEHIDTSAQMAVVWVKIPIAQLRTERSHVWLYYSAAKAVPSASNAIDDAALLASFDFADTAGPPRDSTAYARLNVLLIKLWRLGRAERADRLFLGAFSARWTTDANQLAAGTVPPHESDSGSPLGRMYARGLTELRAALRPIDLPQPITLSIRTRLARN